jgi:serine protease DegQ
VVSVQVEGTASPTLNMPEELKKYFGDNAPQEQAQPFEGWAPASSSMRQKATC